MKYSVLKKILGKNSARNWIEYFGTDKKIQIEQKLKQEGVTWDWINDDLILSNFLPGALKHPITDQTLWFNASHYLNYYSNLLYGELKQVHSYKYLAYQYLILKEMLPMICHYGNGQAFSSNEITKINQIIQTHSHVLNWEKGDFMIVDNFTFMHGKQPHQGNRLLYSGMTQT